MASKSYENRQKKKRKAAAQKGKITKELNKFIKENRSQIITKGKEDLGLNLSDQKVIDLFKANFKERQGDSLSLKKANENMKATLHTETFTGKNIIDYENLVSAMEKEGRAEFRYRRGWNTSIDYEKFKREKAPNDGNVRARYTYDTGAFGIITIDIIYQPDGSYYFSFSGGKERV